MQIRRADPTTDTETVAGLIYDTDRYLFPFLFGARSSALVHLAALFRLEHNSFSWRHTWCAVENGNVVGILIGYDHRAINKEAEKADFRRVLPVWEQWLLYPKYWILQPFLDKSDVTGRYIQNVCVAADYRGRGIGSSLIQHFCSLSEDNVWLDVEMGNKAALALYKRLGFTATREIPILLPGLGSIRMVISPSAPKFPQHQGS